MTLPDVSLVATWTMVVAEDIRNAILRLGTERKGEAFRIDEVARLVSPGQWQDLLDQVRLVVDALIREGKVSRDGRKSTGLFYFTSSAKVRK